MKGLGTRKQTTSANMKIKTAANPPLFLPYLKTVEWENFLARPKKIAHPEQILGTPEETRILLNLNGTVYYKLMETAKRLGFRERLGIKRRP